MRATLGTAVGIRHSLALTSLIGLRCALGIATLAAVCVAGVASAAADGIEGRWVSAPKKLMLDISRCAKGWCGVEVDAGACGRTVLRLVPDQQRDGFLKGSLQLAPESKPYGVQVVLRSNDGLLAITGHTGDRFNPVRRTFDFHAELARIDAPSCTPDNKVS